MTVLRARDLQHQPVVWHSLLASSHTSGSNPLRLQITAPGHNGRNGGAHAEEVELLASGQGGAVAAQQSYDEGYRAGRETGHAEGFQQGQEEARSAVDQQRDAERDHRERLIASLQSGIHDQIASFFARVEEGVTEIALEVAEKIIAVEVQTNPQVARKAVLEALDNLNGPVIKVRMHPADLSLLQPDIAALTQAKDGVKVHLVPDEDMERGGVVAESMEGTADLRPSAKLDSLRAEVV